MSYWIKDKLSKSNLVKKAFLIVPERILRLRKLREIIIEPTNFCNLKCPFCINRYSKRKKGMMKLDDFRLLMKLLPDTVRNVTLHFAGEPFINPDLPEMIKILKNRGVFVLLSSNGTMPFFNYKKAVKAGLDLLLIALDGPEKKMHEKYRIGSDFNKILETIKKISKIKKRKTSIVIQYLVMRHNEKYIEKMKELCRSLGVDELWLKTTSFNIASDEKMEKRVLEVAEEYLPENKKYCRYEIKNGRLINIDKPKVCNWIWKTVILWNGDVGICCTDLEGKVIIGNVFKEKSFEKIWNSRKYAKVRKKIIAQTLSVCKNCNIANKPYVEKIKFKN